MKRLLIAGLTAVGVVAAGGVAWAMLGGTIVLPDISQGFAQGGGGGGCQTSSVTFTVPDPTWSNTAGDWMVSTIGYSGISTVCVNLGTADLQLTLTADNQQNAAATATATNMGSSSGTLTLSSAVPFDTATSGDYYYLVKDN